MINKEEILKNLLKNILEERLKHLEKRSLEQMKDLKLEKESYSKQELLVKKICSVKIEPQKTAKKIMTKDKLGRRDKTPNKRMIRKNSNQKNNDTKSFRSKTTNITIRHTNKKIEGNKKIKGKKKEKRFTPFFIFIFIFF